MPRVSKERVEKNLAQVKQCSHPGKHTVHNWSELGEGNSMTSWHCPGVGAAKKCGACGTVNLLDAERCTACTLIL